MDRKDYPLTGSLHEETKLLEKGRKSFLENQNVRAEKLRRKSFNVSVYIILKPNNDVKKKVSRPNIPEAVLGQDRVERFSATIKEQQRASGEGESSKESC